MGPKGKGKSASDAKSKQARATSIRKKILSRVLPVALLPLLLLTLLTVGGVFLLNQQTSDAVGSAEGLLTGEVSASAVRSSEAAARETAEYVDQWITRVSRLENSAQLRAQLADASNASLAERLDPSNVVEFEATLRGRLTAGTTLLASALRTQLTTDLGAADQPQTAEITFVSEEGFAIGSTNPLGTLDYSQAAWFRETIETGSSFTSFVDDGDGPAAFEYSIWLDPPITTSGLGAAIRVRVALSNVQWLLDQVATDDAVEVSLVDTAAGVLLADSATDHSAEFTFSQDVMASANESGFNPDLLAEGVLEDDVRVSSASAVGDRMNNTRGLSFDWLVQTSQPVDVANASLVEIREVSDDVSRLRQIVLLGLILFLIAASIVAFLSIRSIAEQITEPIRSLSTQAENVAGEGIPNVVEAARKSETLPELPEFKVETKDELATLANSMNTMQDAAVELAAGQARLRRQNVARTFVSLGRRNQNLLNRQLEFITELEQQERDADQLENLFKLDHLATRMRRNAENLLVLAGEQTPRRWGRPIAVRDVIRAAASEIADYPRVRLGEIDAATVSGGLATDLSHLVAELLENAGSFSSPKSPIEVLGQRTSTHYRLAIVDQGIGMDAQALAQVNARLENPVDFADAPSAYLGLFVVGRLAQEMGVTVRLASADPTGSGDRNGTIAFVDLPASLLTEQAAAPLDLDSKDSTAVPAPGETGSAQAAAAAPAAVEGAQPHTPLPAPAVRAKDASDTTSAGFPKRSRGGSGGVPTEPQKMTPSKPAVMEPASTEPAPAPVAETPLPSAPTGDASDSETTSAGFPKRSRGTAPATPPPAAPVAAIQDTTAPKRDASAVSDSLRSIRAAVARGRESGQAETNPVAQAPSAPQSVEPTAPQPVQPQAAMPAPTVTSGENDSFMPPPVPIAEVVPSSPNPDPLREPQSEEPK